MINKVYSTCSCTHVCVIHLRQLYVYLRKKYLFLRPTPPEHMCCDVTERLCTDLHSIEYFRPSRKCQEHDDNQYTVTIVRRCCAYLGESSAQSCAMRGSETGDPTHATEDGRVALGDHTEVSPGPLPQATRSRAAPLPLHAPAAHDPPKKSPLSHTSAWNSRARLRHTVRTRNTLIAWAPLRPDKSPARHTPLTDQSRVFHARCSIAQPAQRGDRSGRSPPPSHCHTAHANRSHAHDNFAASSSSPGAARRVASGPFPPAPPTAKPRLSHALIPVVAATAVAVAVAVPVPVAFAVVAPAVAVVAPACAHANASRSAR